jgi:hypothetical protein
MDIYGKDAAVTKAMALALMRQALDLLDAVKEQAAGCHLQTAIDTLLRKLPPEAGSGPAAH